MDEQENKKGLIIDNVIRNGKVGNLNWRNLIEAGVAVIVIGLAIILLNFVDTVAIILILFLGTIVGFLFVRGYGGQSLIQFFGRELAFRKNKRKLHLRSIEHERKYAKRITTYNDESYIIKTIEQGKKYWEKYQKLRKDE